MLLFFLQITELSLSLSLSLDYSYLDCVLKIWIALYSLLSERGLQTEKQ